ncbi:protein SRG1-like [Carica papaya]|uniref:protein SRG1-like n=1 Tax=Carica papaya TaxID=3649 RepID=UPI000B8D0B4B|nr:protein SRG1-like [Carica papaya]
MASALTFPIKVGHIDDVQELTKTKSPIPERFLRSEAERSTLSATASPPIEIPIVDFSKLAAANNPDEHSTEISNLAIACQEWGFFQVINHGIDVNLLEAVEKVAKEFFMLPLEEKKKYPMAPGTVQGYGQAFIFSEEQKLDWCNMFALGLHPPSLINPKLWPTNPPDFSETLENYSREIRKLCQNLLEYIAETLGLKKNVFEEMFGLTVQAVRMNYYPPCSRPDLVMGLSPHSDGSALTVLQQAKCSYAGLQIVKDNNWISVQPVPNALVINVGDTIEVLTNGKYKSIEHRAVTDSKKDRLSLVTFYAPNYEIEIGPMTEFVDEKNPCKFRKYNHGEYSRHYLANKLRGKKNLDFARI